MISVFVGPLWFEIAIRRGRSTVRYCTERIELSPQSCTLSNSFQIVHLRFWSHFYLCSGWQSRGQHIASLFFKWKEIHRGVHVFYSSCHYTRVSHFASDSVCFRSCTRFACRCVRVVSSHCWYLTPDMRQSYKSRVKRATRDMNRSEAGQQQRIMLQ